MPKIRYVVKNFARSSKTLIDHANRILLDYEKQGFTLTLRQLYYQFVSEALIPNTMKSYKNLGAIINDARLAGLVDWNHIEDRTRSLAALSHWDDPDSIIGSAAESYRVDMWENQKYRPEVWIEKEALSGIFAGVCQKYDVPYFACKGYTSQSEMWGAARRLAGYRAGKQTPFVFHFGDHDPSGKDMTRDIVDRLAMFQGGAELERLALNMDQVEQYKPPPNPAKTTDSRYEGYIAEFGDESWELDALKPQVLVALVETNIKRLINKKVWKEDAERMAEGKALLKKTSEEWAKVAEFVSELEDDS